MNQQLRDDGRIEWLGPLKAVAILWVFLNHFVERVLGFPFISNPSSQWPSIEARARQLVPVDYGSPLTDVALNFTRYLGWAGDQGVQLFLIASGFGLMWSVMRRGGEENFSAFLRRRVLRIYPMWWGAHLLFLALSLLVGRHGMQPFDPKFWMSMAGFRATLDMIYYFSPAWWYIGLILQLYLVFPLLARFLLEKGPRSFLLWTLSVSFLIRLAGLYTFDDYLDAWSRGAIFITRLPEFALGMFLAWWFCKQPAATDRVLTSRWMAVGSMLAYITATGLALTLWGMTVAPFVHGAAAFILIYGLIGRPCSRRLQLMSLLSWLGTISYPLYLTHQPVTAFLVDDAASPTLATAFAGLAAFAVAIIVALILERLVGWAEAAVMGRSRKGSFWSLALRVVGGLAVGVGLLVGAEVAVRNFLPQEAGGWGERPSLEPHSEFGWRLIPSRTTRLRWETYDYIVESNELGFPGPLYPEVAAPGVLRVLTLGDAFTSAEGVDTKESWPRLLEVELQNRLGCAGVEVMNFAVTGYGPKQNAAVFNEYGPRYRPDLVLVGFFVNEFFDVLSTDEEFQSSIGFGSPAQESLLSFLQGSQIRMLIRHRVTDPLREWLTGVPRPYGYFLGNFQAFDTRSEDQLLKGAVLVRLQLEEIKRIADGIGAKVVLVMIPASIQVCDPDDIAYFPRVLDLNDHGKFDLSRPQVLARSISDSLGIPAVDLREPLRLLDDCPYYAWNMHWLPEAHRAAASFLADSLIQGGFIPGLSSADRP